MNPTADPAAQQARPFGRLLPWAVAAAIAIAAAWAGCLWLTARVEVTVLRDEQKLAEMELQSARNQLEAERVVLGRELADLRRQAQDSERRMAELAREVAGLKRKGPVSGGAPANP